MGQYWGTRAAKIGTSFLRFAPLFDLFHLFCETDGNTFTLSFRYRIKFKHFVENKGQIFLNLFEGSPINTLISVYSDHVFVPWLFDSVPRGFFKIRENRQKYVDWLVDKVKLPPHKLQRSHFTQNHGGGLLQSSGGSPQQVIESLTSDSSFGLEERNSDHYVKPREYWVCLSRSSPSLLSGDIFYYYPFSLNSNASPTQLLFS